MATDGESGADMPEQYHVKLIQSEAGSQSIVLQNENGPCALLALANTLVLGDSPMAACVASHQEQGIIDEAVLQAKLGEIASQKESIDRNIDVLFQFLPILSKGLDVNPKFDGTFANSPELELFRLFGIELVHGWILGDLEARELHMKEETRRHVSMLSYEQACERMMTDDPHDEVQQFLRSYPTQMTTTGYLALSEHMKKSHGIAILFWNNHFSTLVGKEGKLFNLVTDLGFLEKKEVVWEEVDLQGAGSFRDGSFKVI